MTYVLRMSGRETLPAAQNILKGGRYEKTQRNAKGSCELLVLDSHHAQLVHDVRAGGGLQDGLKTARHRVRGCRLRVVACGSGLESGHLCKASHDRNRRMQALSSQLKK